MSSEKPTQKEVLEYLKALGVLHWRQNQGKFNGMYRATSIDGLPDIFALKDSVLYGFEIKDIKGKQNPDQKEFERRFKKAGGVYVLVRNVDEVINLFDKK